jgi:hypothetical protein
MAGLALYVPVDWRHEHPSLLRDDSSGSVAAIIEATVVAFNRAKADGWWTIRMSPNVGNR